MSDESKVVSRPNLYGFETREPDKRRRVGERKTYNIQQLWQRSHEIIGLALQGFKQTQIADLLNISPQTVSNTLNSDLGISKLSTLRERRDDDIIKVSEEVARLSKKALQVYEDIFDDSTAGHKIKMEAADKVLLEMGGHRAPTKIQSTSMSFHANAEEIEEFKKRGLENAKKSGMLVALPKIEDKSDEIEPETKAS